MIAGPLAEIRSAVLDDCPVLAHIQVDSYRDAYARFYPPSYLERFSYAEQELDWRDLLAAGTGDLLLVAVPRQEGQVLGYVLARAGQGLYPGYAAEIVSLHVRAEFQRQGIGSALLQTACLRLREKGCQSVMLWTLQANPVSLWYEKLGGRLLGERSFDVDGQGITEVAYGWEAPAELIHALGSAR